jgi:hypothetical protein
MTHRDPMGKMRRLYTHFGDEFSTEAEANMQRNLEAKPKHRFGKHTHNLTNYGLTGDEIRERFSDHCADYDVALSRA